MPTMMRMEETPENENYPLGDFETLAVTLDKELEPGMVYTFYMPANRRGTSTNTDPKYKNNGAPDKALYVQLFVTSRTNGSNFLYTIYLGANDYNDFNVCRNHNYNITLNLKSENRDDRVLAAPTCTRSYSSSHTRRLSGSVWSELLPITFACCQSIFTEAIFFSGTFLFTYLEYENPPPFSVRV